MRRNMIWGLMVFISALLAGTAAAQDLIELWMDDENTYLCYDPWIEEGITLSLVETTDEDCSGAGYCDFGWSEGVIYMHPVRLLADLGSVTGIDSVYIDGWVWSGGDMRAFLYRDGAVVDQVIGHEGGDGIWLYGGGGPVDSLAVSACDGELYEIFLYTSGGTAVEQLPQPEFLRLDACYPNPFNPSTTIDFTLNEAMPLRLSIHDISGRCRRVLASGESWSTGRHSLKWDGADDSGRTLPSGVYLLQMDTPRGQVSRRLTLIK